jgi:IS5 family transposase
MLGKLPLDKGDLFRARLDSIINLNHELVRLSQELDWSWLEGQLESFYAVQGNPSIPVRQVAGLLLLKQMFNQSDESVIDRWIENPYWQYFTGETCFQTGKPFDPSDFVLFRKRIGESGMEKILTLSIKLHPGEESAEIVQMDTTVQEKNITYPTDQKLASRFMAWTRRIAQWSDIKLRQTFEKEEKKLRRLSTAQYRTKEGHRKRKAAIKRLKTIAGRLIRDVQSKLTPGELGNYNDALLFFKEILAQQRMDKNKVYSVHEPDVSCIAKGKAHKKYEFGCKVSVGRTAGKGVITGMKCFRGNPYDGDTIAPTLEQMERILEPIGGQTPKNVIYDRGGRGRKQIGKTTVMTPMAGPRNLSKKEKNTLKQLFRGRAAIEPIIRHLKSDFGLDRNFLSGILGDAVNALLAGAAYNLKMRLRELKASIFGLFRTITRLLTEVQVALISLLNYRPTVWTF